MQPNEDNYLRRLVFGGLTEDERRRLRLISLWDDDNAPDPDTFYRYEPENEDRAVEDMGLANQGNA